MVKIRLRRMGAKKAPFYRIVVADSRQPPQTGRCIEEIGTYNPLTDPATVIIDAEKAQQWIKNGAQPDRIPSARAQEERRHRLIATQSGEARKRQA